MQRTYPTVYPLLTLLVVLWLPLTSCQARKSLFPNLPRRCPSSCTCDTNNLGKKRVVCNEGGLTDIPTHQMDKESQVIIFTGPPSNANKVTIGRIFLELDALEEVHITHSNLPAIGDSSFWPGKQLNLLDLSHNSIRHLRDSDFNGLSRLKILNLSNNQLTEAPSAPFRFLSNLTRLSMARNKLNKLVPRLFYKLERLEYLDLSENPLTELFPDDLRDVKKTLKILLMESCHLKRISAATFKGMPKLKELDLKGNQLTSLAPLQFSSLTSMKVLQLDSNRLNVIHENAFQGLRLIHLGLSNNNLQSAPSCTFCGSSLESLDISSNNFVNFEAPLLEPLAHSLVAFNGASNRNLGNPSQAIRRLIGPLKKVQILKLSETSLDDSLEESLFTGFSKLLSLDLSGNRLMNVSSKLFVPLINLETLDLSQNLLQGLSRELLTTFDSIGSLKAIYLNGNPWSCYRCHILPLMDWINSSPAAYFNVCSRNGKRAGQFCVQCAIPENMAGKDLHLITELDLEWCADPRIQLRLTASEPKVGFLLALLIVVSLTVLVITVIILYRKQGAVYYTHEEERCEPVKTCSIFDVTPSSEKAASKSSYSHPSSSFNGSSTGGRTRF